jgi:hypothetical protein
MTDPLLELKTLETEINGLLSRYQQVQMDYTNSVASGLNTKAGIDLQELNELNGRILQKIERAKTLALLAIPTERKNNGTITGNIPDLKEKADRLSKEKQLIDGLLEKQHSIIGANKTISLERQSNYYKYISMFFVSILIIGITIRAYFTDSTSSVELFIALIAALLIIYHLITYFL